MAYNEQMADRIRRFFAPEDNIAERKMMGALCFMMSGNMCCGVTGNALMIRVGSEQYPDLVGKPNVRPLEFAGRRPQGFLLVDPLGYQDPEAFKLWIQRGVDFAAKLPVKKPKR